MRAIAMSLPFLLGCSCGPGAPTTLTVTGATSRQSAADSRVTVEVAIKADGKMTDAQGSVLLGSTEVAKLSPSSYGDDTRLVLKGDFAPEMVFGPKTHAAVGEEVPIALTVRVAAAGLTASAELSSSVGCGQTNAICAGRCADLSADERNCGACGNGCDLQLSASVYEGRCQQSRCLWPGLTRTSSPSPCATICGSSQFKSKPLVCRASCDYTGTFDSAYPSDSPGTYVGAVRYFSGMKVISSCTHDPAVQDSQYGSFRFQMCCCEQAP
ncbi:MAG: hypothetical protein ACYC8T_19795 [Myxococcaceae bacterium]